jgi:CubicO group peptidase (beta-lactamase class C family)
MKWIILMQIGFLTMPLLSQKQLIKTLDSIIWDSIDSMAFPGAQLYVYHGDSVLHHTSYGYHTYDKKRRVENHHVYDLASVTKVSSGLPLLMKLVDKGKFDIDLPAKTYIPDWEKSNKSAITFREILAHQAGLSPYIVFWEKTIKDNGDFKRRTFKNKQSKRFPTAITDSLFLHKKYVNRMKDEIKKSEMGGPKYRYSGLSFLRQPDIIESIIEADFEQQLYVNIYDPIGIDRLRYNPQEHFSLTEIVPTEIDTLFRKTLVHGYVHDEAAAMLKGISCNAGLFGNAESVGKLFRMYLDYGNWNGDQIISEKTMREFTRYQYPENDNRRGLGFDKPLQEYNEQSAYVAKSASPSSFGHSGFTGTFVWADPVYDLVFVLMSNRVYPYRSQRKLYTMNIRPKLHQAVYDWLFKEL